MFHDIKISGMSYRPFPLKANLCTHLFNILITRKKTCILSSLPFKGRARVGMGLKSQLSNTSKSGGITL